MARIAGVTAKQASLFTRLVYRISRGKIRKMTGRAEVVEPVRNLAHHTRILFGVGQMDLAIEAASSISNRYKDLAMLKVAQMIGCPF